MGSSSLLPSTCRSLSHLHTSLLVPFAYRCACKFLLWCVQFCIIHVIIIFVKSMLPTGWGLLTNLDSFLFIDNKLNYKNFIKSIFTFSIYAWWSFKQILETTNLWTSLKYICKPIKYSFKSKKVLVYDSKNILLMLDNNFDVRFPTLRFLLCRCFLNRMS